MDGTPKSGRARGWSGRIAVAAALVLSACAALALSACAAPPPPPPPPTVVKLSLSATADANGAAPTIVRVYQLASAAGFEKAEFFRLFNGDTALLGQDLVKKDEYLLAPGATKEETLTLPDKVQAIGVLAAYREFQTRTWRAVVPVPPNKTTPIKAAVTAPGLVAAPAAPGLVAAPAAPAP